MAVQYAHLIRILIGCSRGKIGVNNKLIWNWFALIVEKATLLETSNQTLFKLKIQLMIGIHIINVAIGIVGE